MQAFPARQVPARDRLNQNRTEVGGCVMMIFIVPGQTALLAGRVVRIPKTESLLCASQRQRCTETPCT